MTIHRRAALAMLGAGLAGPGLAQGPYPDRPIRVIVPFAAGSASDIVGRIVLETMADDLGHRFVVENQAGASGNLGTAAVARAEPDGYTILVSASGPLAVNQSLFPRIGYDPLVDFEPISLIATLPNIIVVNADQPLRSVADLIEAARKEPGKLNYGSIGNGSSQHLAAAYFEQVTGTRMAHVPYRVTGQLVSDLVGGQLQVSFQLIPNVLGQIQGGQLRPLAVTANKRSEVLPQVPTVAEVGLAGYEAYGWFAMLAPKNTPAPIIARLHVAYLKAMSNPATGRRIVEVGAEPATSTPAELRLFMQAEATKWGNIIRANGIKPN
ncbi:Bug family tripartite tricarboxylate transporter substrate binding protein [Phreatobacter sp. AB_2022a]|uniref:Bug family tripartite tricarboxylate transporter substrate binding protein n=1 Tax=Phreatobacter sp. AB_2022a TaxID=3003134 RepID=UPI00228747D8|nr:tripartite tricarboxylate transporter substrate binding protein [Phreatobacter sp. AB_2022a]MCZ0733878.1 tripartite tricarboxylate transporter substrate binding protein [Phreatobacter sp. AB_2022a]